MKKLILFLLLPLWAMAQTSTTKEQEFDYGIKNNSAQTITTPPYLTTTGMDGTQGKIPSAIIEKTDNKQNSLAVDGTGTKYPTVDAVNAALPKTYATIVYVNTTSPTTATVFDDENPPTVNDNVLKTNVANLYIGTDGSKWVYKTSPAGYVTEIVPDGSNFYLYNTTTDAGNNKTAFISRTGGIKTTGTLEGNTVRGISLYLDGETTNTIAGFDGARQLKSLPTITYPSLTELSYVKGATGGIQAQINGKADLDGSGKVPLSQINDALLGSVNYKGTYDATTNTPAIPTAASSNKGWYYIISTAGTQQGFNFVNGDWIISNGTSWGKVDNNNAVTSVNGQVGAVNLTKSDVGLGNVDNTSDVNKPISTATQTALNLKQNTLTNPITGTLTTNYIPKATGSGTLGNSQVFDDGTYVGINNNTPTRGLHIKSNTATGGVLIEHSSVASGNILEVKSNLNGAYFAVDYGGAIIGTNGINITGTSNFAKLGVSATPNFAYIEGNGANGIRIYGAAGIDFQTITNSDALHINQSGRALFNTSTDNGIDIIQANGSISATSYTGSATLTGTPTAPTAAPGTNTTQIATMAALQAAVTSNIAQTITNGVTTSAPSQDAVFDALALKADLSGAVFTGFLESATLKTAGNLTFTNTGTGLSTASTNFVQNNPATPGWTSSGSITAIFYTTTVYTVATLPTITSGTAYATVSDATAPTYLGTLTGGGTVVCPVFYNGTAWVAH